MRPFGRASEAGPAARQRRNDLCACGSGRKHKHCCAGMASPPGPPAPAPAPAARPPGEAAGGPAEVRALRQAGRLAEATRLAGQILGRSPSDPAAHDERGMAHLQAGRLAPAVECLRAAVSLAPGDAVLHGHLARALEAAGRAEEAAAAFRRGLALAPRDPDLLERLGNLLLACEQREEAAALFRRAAAAAADTTAGRINLAKALVEEARPAEAEALLRRAVALDPGGAEAHRFLAAILREQGRFAEAIPHLEQATHGDAMQAATAYHDLANSKRVTEADQEMLDRMQALARLPGLPGRYRARAHFGLGKACDDLGRFEEAMRHFDAGNALAREGQVFDRAHFGASVRRLITTFTKEALAAHSPEGSDSELPVLIVGMPRSGTTLVERIVARHPRAAAGGELAFWNRQAAAAAAAAAGGGPAWLGPGRVARIAAEYEALLRGIGPAALRVADKQPGNFLWLGLIRLAFPRARIIHCRRHPADVCLSNYATLFAAPLPFTCDTSDLAFYWRWYKRLMDHWSAALPDGAMLDVQYEELVADAPGAARRIVGHLGLDWDDSCLSPEAPGGVVRTASMWQARQPVYRTSVERWRNYEPWLGGLRSLLSEDDPDCPVQPVSADPALPASRRLRAAGRLDEAAAALREAAGRSPRDALLWNELGGACLESGRADAAAECFERALGLNPRFAAACANLGAALQAQGRRDGAAAAFREALALMPDLHEARRMLDALAAPAETA